MYAIRSYYALSLAGCRWEELTLIDMHEAFAAQVLCTLQCLADEAYATQTLGLAAPLPPVDPARFNVLGGSIAYGHPFAATGARMITQTLRELQRRGGGLALTSACAAGGLGVAIVITSYSIHYTKLYDGLGSPGPSRVSRVSHSRPRRNIKASPRRGNSSQ